MDAQTLRALKASIAHWKRLATGKAKHKEVPFGSHCALCHLFFYNYDGHGHPCEGCPVATKTGMYNCRKTPWRKASDQYGIFGKHSPEFKASARKELEFLKRLLPMTAQRSKQA